MQSPLQAGRPIANDEPAQIIPAPSSAAATDMLGAYLRQVVSIHTKMFEKLLFDQRAMSHELADLFEEAGTSYLQLSEMISMIQPSAR
jgi:hypothetical protein